MIEAADPAPVEQRARIESVRLFLHHLRGGLIPLALITTAVMVVGKDLVDARTWMAWSVLACANALAQAALWRATQRSNFQADTMRRWLPWLTTSITINGLVWGAIPWLVSHASTAALVSACLFNSMLLFSMVSAPATPAIVVLGSLPIGALGAAALVRHGLGFHAGAGYVVLVAAIAFYGLRLQAALRVGIVQRHAAEDLALDLRRHQQRLIALERERTLLLERQRLTRDMHDGIGSALVHSLKTVERGEVLPDRLAATLRECVDDLRAVIDSLEPIDHDLVALLATLRFRMEQRLSAAGIRLEWQIADVPALPWLGATEALHVTRMVQEILSNIVKHAAARNIGFTVETVDDEVVICIADDGHGFDLETTHAGRGLKSLPERAALLGGRIEFDSRAGSGTTVRLRLPIGVGAAGNGPGPVAFDKR